MILRPVLLAAAALLLAGCGASSDQQELPGTAKVDAEGKRQSSLTSSAAPAPPAPSDRQSSLTSTAQLRSELGAQATDRGLLVALPNDVLFDYDKADLRPDAAASLDKLAMLARSQQGPITVEGHSDSNGDDAYNLALSKRRADAVAAALASRGVEAGRVRASGLGEGRPIAPNATPSGQDDPAGRQRNRRVEVVLPL